MKKRPVRKISKRKVFKNFQNPYNYKKLSEAIDKSLFIAVDAKKFSDEMSNLKYKSPVMESQMWQVDVSVNAIVDCEIKIDRLQGELAYQLDKLKSLFPR